MLNRQQGKKTFGAYLVSLNTEMEFVNAVTAGGIVKFVASSVNFSICTHFLCFFLLKLKLGEIDSVNFST